MRTRYTTTGFVLDSLIEEYLRIYSLEGKRSRFTVGNETLDIWFLGLNDTDLIYVSI